LIIPPYLKPGDAVAIISTARSFTLTEVQPFVLLLESWGLKVEMGNTLGKTHHQFAGTDEERASDFQCMINEPNIKAIFCARGGYGTAKIIDQIDFSVFRKKPKWICGFSDMTVLHATLQQQCGVASLHTITALQLKDVNLFSLYSLKSALFGGSITYALDTHPLNRWNVKQQMKGLVVGGNLSVLYSISGSVSDINTNNKILFLEDLDEYLYHIDRMMVQLKRAGKLNNLAGLLVGSFSDMKDNTVPFGKTAEAIIKEAVAEYTYPVVFGFPAGHTKQNYALKMGIEIEIYEHKGQIVTQQ